MSSGGMYLRQSRLRWRILIQSADNICLVPIRLMPHPTTLIRHSHWSGTA